MSAVDASPALVIHGHFYQPPREDPWTGVVPEQPGAAPFHDWNERVTAECYRPNTSVEVPGDDGSVQVLNSFELLSFNVGPTLLSWLEPHHPDVYERIVQADRATGRAIAQAYGHAILPLCNDRDLRTQVRWGIADFRHRFGRFPEGMWLPETAVSERVLAVLAEEGISFTILAPPQIEAIRPLAADVADLRRRRGRDGGGAEVERDTGPERAWREHGGEDEDAEVGELGAPRRDAEVATGRAYRWCHPERPELGVDLVVYDGSLAHALAFGTPSSEAIVDAAISDASGVAEADGDLVTVATDGETFGHHHKGAERVVAHALSVEAPRRGVRVPRLADELEKSPPTHQARVRTSAWSCAHGVGRWMADCGCRTGGDPSWSQAWREPLRNALDLLRDWGVEAFERLGVGLLAEPWAARDGYLDVLLGARSWDAFAAEHIVGDHHRAGVLLDAQRNALLMYTSCGWFFNDLAGIETVQILRYAARCIDLHQQLGESPPVDDFLAVLADAVSNDPAVGDGRRLWFTQVLPR
jgi:hypothetical protein